tara:strand:+ start:810 stop:2069 length:1260 start_codon:yes stop_codon:yes gene_type:complete
MNYNIAIIGLGYVGLPLAVEFGKKYNTFGYDINVERVNQLKRGIDLTLESNEKDIKSSTFLSFHSIIDEIKKCNIYIITVPTPIDKFKNPDLKPLLNASEMVGKILKKNDIVIYESTVYPGCTEEDCVPILEKNSGLEFNKDFYCGYSPERINPGDKINTLTKIVKVTSGSNHKTANEVDNLYKSIITAGTFKAKSIKVAEASKAIENAQRDVNISFVNELALIFDRIGIDTQDVLDAAGTKWNFLKYKPGLVGGHCIGVDPYYLAHKAQSLGYNPDVILSGRKVNDNMSLFIANKVMKLMISNQIIIKKSKILILGFSFKEDCPDFRNTKIIDVHNELRDFGAIVEIYDPYVNKKEVKNLYSIDLINKNQIKKYDAIILAVGHSNFKKIDINDLKSSSKSVVFDVKGILDRNIVNSRL